MILAWIFIIKSVDNTERFDKTRREKRDKVSYGKVLNTFARQEIIFPLGQESLLVRWQEE